MGKKKKKKKKRKRKKRRPNPTLSEKTVTIIFEVNNREPDETE